MSLQALGPRRSCPGPSDLWRFPPLRLHGNGIGRLPATLLAIYRIWIFILTESVKSEESVYMMQAKPSADLPSPSLECLGERMAGERRRRKWSQRELGRRCEIRPDRIAKLERGGDKPTLAETVRLARAFEISLDSLVFGGRTGNDWGEEKSSTECPSGACLAESLYDLLSDELPKSAPGDWDEGAGLREVTLASFPLPSAQALRLLVGELYNLYVENPPGFLPEPTPSRQLEAVELDLRHSARVLALIARGTLRVFVSGSRDRRRGLLADCLAVEVERIADQIGMQIRPRRKATRTRKGVRA